MEALREFVQCTNKQLVINVPHSLPGETFEVIAFPVKPIPTDIIQTENVFPKTTIDQVVGCLPYQGLKKTSNDS